jgi:hypothetical protein
MNRRSLAVGLVVASLALVAAACGKKSEPKAEAAKAPETAAAPTAAEPTAPVAEVVAPPPDVGMPFETFYAARLLENCAKKYGVAEKTAERMAIDWTKGKKPELHLDAVFQKPDAKAKPAAEPKEDHAMELEREAWRMAVHIASDHTATAAKLKDETETCLYAPEVGLIEGKTIATYVKVFAEVTCLQKQVGADGKSDDLGHAQAAAKIFQDNTMTAGEFSRYGLIFARFPVVIQESYKARHEKCPDAKPTTVGAPAPANAVYNGVVTGERVASVRLEDRGGKLTGAVQWQGVPPPALDGRPQPPAILPLSGAVTGNTFAVSGEMQGESFKLSGKVEDKGLSGTWNNVRPGGVKAKGVFKADKLAATAPVVPPVAK